MAHATATVDMMHPPAPAERGLDVYNNKLGMWVFLASEVMFFTALIGSYIILRFGAPGPWAPPAKRSEERRVGKECRSRRTPNEAEEHKKEPGDGELMKQVT